MRSLLLKTSLILVLACLPALTIAATAQDKPADAKTAAAEIVGEYHFSVYGQTRIVQISENEGKLYAKPLDEPAELMSPVKDKPLCFDFTLVGGDYYVLQFVRNDQGLVDKCVLTFAGWTFEGAKVIK